jgi:hypothetical protein
MTLLDEPASSTIMIENIPLDALNSVTALQGQQEVIFELQGQQLQMTLPDLEEAPAYTFKLSTGTTS